MTSNAPRIALVHATPLAMAPIADAFSRLWPEARTTNLLDDSLSADLRDSGHLDAHMMGRFATLGRYAVDCGSDAILFTCSAFGPAIDAVKRQHAPLQVLKPNEAMFQEALNRGRKIGMVATFAPSIASMAVEFAELAAPDGNDQPLRSVCAEGAMEALAAGDSETHDRLIAEAAAKLTDCDVVMLAQFSMARAHSAVTEAVGSMPVLTSPDSAIRRLKAALT
jgi:Asp/Glu/Hydantoin racemase